MYTRMFGKKKHYLARIDFIIHPFIFNKHFGIQRTEGARGEYIRYRMPVHHMAPFTHTFVFGRWKETEKSRGNSHLETTCKPPHRQQPELRNEPWILKLSDGNDTCCIITQHKSHLVSTFLRAWNFKPEV